MFESILILAAHPDDEVLGCGGTIARFAKAGSSIHIAFFSDGHSSRMEEGELNLNKGNFRRNAAIKAADFLGVKTVSFEKFPDNQFDTVPLLKLAISIESLLKKFNPRTVITHHSGDLNVDHRRLSEAAAIAARPQPGNCVKQILNFEILSSTEWQLNGFRDQFFPNLYINISDYLDIKLEALNFYEIEMRPWPHPRSRQGVENLASYRGASVGLASAEAFYIARKIL